MKTVLKLILLLAIAGLGYLGFLASQKPDQYIYAQDRVIHATPDALFAQANDLHNFNTWSPWAKIDPNAKVVFEGPASGAGAIMSWNGNMKLGKGSMVITGANAFSDVTYNLIFQLPLPGTSTAQMKFEPVAGGTKVTWSMTGTSNLFQKMIAMAFDCETMIKNQFAAGLANLAAKTEH